MYYFERLLWVLSFAIVMLIGIVVGALWVLITPFKKRPVPAADNVEENSKTVKLAVSLRDALNDYLVKQEAKEA